MDMNFCNSCGRETGFKRALGWGTYFAVILTGGLWLLAIPFYPKRCVVCGTPLAKGVEGGIKEKIKTILPIIDLPLVILALYMIFLYVRADATLGESQRIFYFHVSYAWIGFLSLFCNFVGSIMYLIKKDRFWDILAVSSAEIGIVFCLVVLTTGPIWGKAAWGAWWTWDPRLVTFLILTFIYVAYMVVRNSIDEETKRGRFSAVIGIIGFLNVPLTYVASHLWRTIHPNVIQPGRKWSMDNDMTMTLRVSIIAITILFIFLLLRRMDLEVMKDRLAELRKKIMKEA